MIDRFSTRLVEAFSLLPLTRCLSLSLLSAGFETSSNTTTFCIYYLAKNPEIQDKLRKHILANQESLRSDPDSPEAQMITNIILETLRLIPPVVTTERIAMKDMVIPLFSPIKGVDGQEIQ